MDQLERNEEAPFFPLGIVDLPTPPTPFPPPFTPPPPPSATPPYTSEDLVFLEVATCEMV